MATDSAEAELQCMGFDTVRIREALRVCGGNVERAIDYLLAYDDDHAGVPTAAVGTSLPQAAGTLASSAQQYTTSPAFSSSTRMIVAHNISQYSFENGRSACTCIALRTASAFLENPSIEILSSEFLQQVIQEGVTIYAEFFVGQEGSSESEHVSAEEALEKDRNSRHFRKLRLGGSIRQGLLHKNPKHPRGLLTLLLTCRKENKSSEWMAIVFTKPPESIVLLVPPEGTFPLVLVDSHARPSLGADGAYIQFHNSWESLLQPLLSIFPPTDLGPDVAEWMDMVYNSFDLYPLVWDKSI